MSGVGEDTAVGEAEDVVKAADAMELMLASGDSEFQYLNPSRKTCRKASPPWKVAETKSQLLGKLSWFSAMYSYTVVAKKCMNCDGY